MPSPYFVKPNSSFNDCVYEDDILTTVFEHYLPLVTRQKERPFMIELDSMDQLKALIDKNDFFVFWIQDQQRTPTNYFRDSDDDESSSYDDAIIDEYKSPNEDLKSFFNQWLTNAGQHYDSKISEDYFDNKLFRNNEIHFVNEYYGDHTNYRYLHMEKDKLLEDLHDYAENLLNKPKTSNKNKIKIK
jgi:hypothetical protein